MADTPVLAPSERALVLRSYAPFGLIETPLLVAIMRQTREERFRRGEFILESGATHDVLHLLVAGRALVTGSEHDGELLEPTTPIAPLGFFAARGADTEAKAFDDVLTLALDQRTIADALAEEPDVAQAIIAHIAEQSIVALQHSLRGAFIATSIDSGIAGEADLGWDVRLRAVEHANLFSSSSVALMLDLARLLEPVTVPAGTFLWRAGEPADSALLLVSGRLQGVGDGDVEFTAGAGFQAGLLESLGSLPRWYDARAETRLRGFRLRRSQALDLMEHRPEVTREIVAQMALRVLEPEAGSSA